VSTFLDRALLESAVQEISYQPSHPSPKRALAHMVIALGVHIIGSEDRRKLPEGPTYNPLVQFNAALKLKPLHLEKSFSVRDFQASLIL
jgi:hypothetical protein